MQVLATLFLLSYTKLLRVIITAFSPTFLEYPDHSIKRIWLYDGNVDYLQRKHTVLFLTALLLFLTISLPYTAALLFIQCLQKKSTYRILFWVQRLKPIFDAYTVASYPGEGLGTRLPTLDRTRTSIATGQDFFWLYELYSLSPLQQMY